MAGNGTAGARLRAKIMRQHSLGAAFRSGRGMLLHRVDPKRQSRRTNQTTSNVAGRMRTLSVGFAVALVVIVVMDALWLGLIALDFYKARIGHIMSDQPIWVAAILFYVVHALGIAVFAVPAARAGSAHWAGALGYGALYGLCVFAAYDLTNQATLREWPVSLTIVDLIWGSVITAVATTAAALATRVDFIWLRRD